MTTTGAASADVVLDVRDLVVEYDTGARQVRAVDGVSFTVERGGFLGIVGESGCGKTSMLQAVCGLLRPPARLVDGEVLFDGQDLTRLSAKQLRPLRWSRLSVVLQSAMNALNPVTRIDAQFTDVLHAHGVRADRDVRSRCVEAMRLVGIDPVHLQSYPHQLSGGMRQRVMIAMALLLSPDLIVMDEPTSALDVVAQRSLMTKIKELQADLGFAVIFVTHDMSTVARFSTRLGVMYAGTMVEIGQTADVVDRPRHPYTRGLFAAYPDVYGEWRELSGIPGAPPDLASPMPGCRFAPRCPAVIDACTAEPPPPVQDGGTTVRCIRTEELAMSNEG